MTLPNIYDGAFLQKLLTAESNQIFSQKSSIIYVWHCLTYASEIWKKILPVFFSTSPVNKILFIKIPNKHFPSK